MTVELGGYTIKWGAYQLIKKNNMKTKQIEKLLEEVAIITIMVEKDLLYKDAKLVYTYPDLVLGKKVEHYQTNPY